MSDFLYSLVGMIAKIHSYIMHLNDAYEYNFTDKELHFLVIGVFGMGIVFVVYPIFKALANSGHIMIVAWIYVFTLIIVITFAIEIGQKITHTGNMDFKDIMSGILGFLAMFLVFSVVRGIYHGIKKAVKHWKKKKRSGR